MICTMRKHLPFTEGEYYHVYNRGVEKRDIVMDWKDSERFMQSLEEFNTVKPIGSIYQNSFREDKNLSGPTAKKLDNRLVDIVAYCLNPNHYHLILIPLVEKGIEKFMHKLGGGFTCYFNEKYNRSGALFQGRFKSAHIDSNEYLLHVCAYVNLNDKVHQLSGPTAKLVRSSWKEYMGEAEIVFGKKGKKEVKNMCNKNIILGQFKNIKEYEKHAKESLEFTLENRYGGGELSGDLLARDEYPDMFEMENKLKNK